MSVKTYCVVAHSSGNGDYVVRTAHDGWWLPQPYSEAIRLAEYNSFREAQAFADKLNRGERA